MTPSRLTLSAGSRVASTLYLGPMPPTAPPRQFSVTVTGQSTGVAHSRSIMVAAGQEGPDFSIACCGPTNDGSISVHSGETYDSWMSVSALNNFTGTISLAVNLPFAATIDPSIVSLPAGQNASFVVRPSVSISVPASIASGVYGGILTGTSGSLSHTFTLSVTVATPPPDFSLKVAETFLNIPQSSSATTTLTLTSINGLAGPISLSPTVSPEPECNPQVSVDPGTITLSAGETKTAVLTVTVGPLPLGSNATHFQIMVTGTYQSSTAQTISHEVTIDAYILPPPPDFMLEVQPSTMTLSPGTSGTFYLTITSLNDFAGQVVLSTSLSLHTVLEPPQVTLAPGENAEATLTVNIPQGTVGGYSGSVTASTGERISSIQVSVTVSPTTEDPYFELTATPSSIGPLLSGETGSTTIYVNPQGGFTGNVTIWALSNSSSGFVFSLDRIWVMSSGDVTLTISAEFPGNYTIVVTGTSGGLTHSVYVLIIVADQPTSDLTLSASQALATGESPDPHSFLPAYSERQ